MMKNKYIYGNTPAFLGCEIDLTAEKEADVVVAGVPWEGGVTWDSYAGCELLPKAIRNVSARYSGYLPELDDIDIHEHLKLIDYGDMDLVPADNIETFRRIREHSKKLFATGKTPIFLGGDHSITFPIIEAHGQVKGGKIGIIHMDAHFDNRESFGDDPFARCCPFARISELPNVKTTSMVHFGIRGARNKPQDGAFAKKIGAKVITINDVRKRDILELAKEAYAVAAEGTDAVYVTVCSDVLDIAYNPGGPLDGNGMTTYELFNALYYFATQGIAGFDVVEIYPPNDPRNTSSHIAVQMILYVLAGLAKKKIGSSK